MPTPRHSIGLGPKILSRARLVFSLLVSAVVILTVAGIYQGIQSGEFNKVFIKPFKQFSADLQKAMETTPAPSPLATPASVPTSSSKSTSTSATKVIINQTAPEAPVRQPVVSNCFRMNIREGEFAGNKCYSQQDYEDLQYYLGRYETAKLNLSSAEGFMKIDCGAAQTFEVKKADCEKDQQDKTAAEAEVNKYRGIIQGIITKGK